MRKQGKKRKSPEQAEILNVRSIFEQTIKAIIPKSTDSVTEFNK